jgi:hypothetical protein
MSVRMLVDVRKVDVHPPIKIPLSVCLCGKLKNEGTVMLKLNQDNFLEPSKQVFFILGKPQATTVGPKMVEFLSLSNDSEPCSDHFTGWLCQSGGLNKDATIARCN